MTMEKNSLIYPIGISLFILALVLASWYGQRPMWVLHEWEIGSDGSFTFNITSKLELDALVIMVQQESYDPVYERRVNKTVATAYLYGLPAGDFTAVCEKYGNGYLDIPDTRLWLLLIWGSQEYQYFPLVSR